MEMRAWWRPISPCHGLNWRSKPSLPTLPPARSDYRAWSYRTGTFSQGRLALDLQKLLTLILLRRTIDFPSLEITTLVGCMLPGFSSFQIGEKVVYPNQGIGTIENISTRSFGSQSERFYLLRVRANSTTVMVPFSHVDDVGLRTLTRNATVARPL